MAADDSRSSAQLEEERDPKEATHPFVIAEERAGREGRGGLWRRFAWYGPTAPTSISHLKIRRLFGGSNRWLAPDFSRLSRTLLSRQAPAGLGSW